MIINIRGASGAGKTTVVRGITAGLELKPLNWTGGNKPDGYVVEGVSREPLFLLGSYENNCGGCDAIKTQDLVCDGVRRLSKFGHVIFEGLLVGKISQRYHDLSVELGGIKFLFLDTPLEVCLERVRGRRAERGDGRPFNTTNTESAHKQCARSYELLKIAGSDVAWLDHREPVAVIKQLLTESENGNQLQYLGAKAALDLYSGAGVNTPAPRSRKPAPVDERPSFEQVQLL
jgi:hypothetical protein